MTMATVNKKTYGYNNHLKRNGKIIKLRYQLNYDRNFLKEIGIDPNTRATYAYISYDVADEGKFDETVADIKKDYKFDCNQMRTEYKRKGWTNLELYAHKAKPFYYLHATHFYDNEDAETAFDRDMDRKPERWECAHCKINARSHKKYDEWKEKQTKLREIRKKKLDERIDKREQLVMKY